jgi:DNA-binding response OmpR family regulator
MLPPSAYADVNPRRSVVPITRATAEPKLSFVVVASARDAEGFQASNLTRYVVHSTAEALRMIETARPRVVALDWDAAEIDGPQVCIAARQFVQTGVLIATSEPARVPAALKAGCHAVLLKPFAPNLVAARIGRLCRELPSTPTAARVTAAVLQSGTNRVWPDTVCPNCAAGGAVSFEFSSYRRMWYACLGCETVWLGPRQE